MKFVADRPYAKPEAAAKRLLEYALAIEDSQNRIHVEKVNCPFLFQDKASPAEYGAGIKWLIAEGLIQMHESGGHFTLTEKAKQNVC
ncbi:hypothetical protein X566_20245 [Afipia sp. P52-10]|nr:hypothetical protein X566_20245 [Afipia sp. P52-10]